MKAVERRSHERMLRVYGTLLRRLERLGPASDAPDDLDGFGEVKDYLLERIAAHRQALGVPS